MRFLKIHSSSVFRKGTYIRKYHPGDSGNSTCIPCTSYPTAFRVEHNRLARLSVVCRFSGQQRAFVCHLFVICISIRCGQYEKLHLVFQAHINKFVCAHTRTHAHFVHARFGLHSGVNANAKEKLISRNFVSLYFVCCPEQPSGSKSISFLALCTCLPASASFLLCRKNTHWAHFIGKHSPGGKSAETHSVYCGFNLSNHGGEGHLPGALNPSTTPMKSARVQNRVAPVCSGGGARRALHRRAVRPRERRGRATCLRSDPRGAGRATRHPRQQRVRRLRGPSASR